MKGISIHRISTAATDTIPSGQTHGGGEMATPAGQREEPRTALITGGSSGIGSELARVFAGHGHNLVLVARDRNRLSALAEELRSTFSIQVHIVSRDLSSPTAPTELYRELLQRSLGIDILVNNAGFAAGGRFSEADPSDALQLVQVNVAALTHLTRLFLPDMIHRGWGRLLHVASIAAFFPGPLTACYNASKAYVLSLSLALSNELRGTGVTSTVLCPGPTRTGFARRARLLGTRAFSGRIMEPAEVARVGYDALMEGKPQVISGFKNKLRMFPVPLVPRRVLAYFSRIYHERCEEEHSPTVETLT